MEEKCCSRELLIFVPLPFLTHLVPAVELASQLIHRRPNLSVVFMLLHQPFDPKAHSYAKSISTKGSANSGLKFVHLPEPEAEPDLTPNAPISPAQRMSQSLQSQTHLVEKAVAEIMDSNSTARLAGFFIDMFCSAMIDVANVFRVPTYSFYIAGAGILDTFHFHSLIQDSDHQVLQDYSDPNLDSDNTLISIPGYANPVPVKMLPTSFFDKTGLSVLLHHARRLRETKGILLTTFMEFEFDTINVLLNDPLLPPIYPVGPMINLQGINNQNDRNEDEEEETMKIMKWLDDQPVSSVVLLSFGSGGSFGESQIKEIAYGVERSGQRFIWSFRPGKNENDQCHHNHDVFPEGFLERVSGIGIVAPWVPQARVLSHPLVGGFVTHCGWSSLMEGAYLGVPMAVWPMHSDQQMNAFMLVKELKIGVDMKMDYRLDFSNPDPDIVEADRIEDGIRELMDVENGAKMRERVKEMKEKAMLAVLEGGSSYMSMACLIEDIFK